MKEQFNFLKSGNEFFRALSEQKIEQWFKLLLEQIGAVEVALKQQNARRVDELAYVQGSDLAEITAGVDRRLKEGWQPFGGLIFASDAGATIYFQAMAKSSVH